MRAFGRRLVQPVAFGTLALTAGSVVPATGQAQESVIAPVPRTTVVLGPVATPLPVSLRLPSATVALSLGDVGLLSRDADVLFYNPGMLSLAVGLSASVQRFGSVATAGSYAAIQSVGGYSIGLGARFVDWQSIESQLEPALRAGSGVFSQEGPTRASSLALTGGVGRALGPLRLGVSATYLRESFRFDRDEALLLDAGVAMSLGPGQVALAVQGHGGTVQLPGSDRTRPWRSTLGYGIRPFPISTFFDLGAVAQVSLDGDEELRPAGGLELSYIPVEGFAVTARAGARRPRDDGESIFTAGLGVSLDRFSLDYALDPYRDGAAAHRLGIRVR